MACNGEEEKVEKEEVELQEQKRGDGAAAEGDGAAEVADCSLLSACIVHSCTAQNSRVHCGQQNLIDDGKLKGFL